MEGWANGDATDPDDDEGQERYRSYKALRLCTDYKVFPDSGVDGSRIAPRILGQPDATACYKYVAWCSDNAREFFDLSTDPYETRNRCGYGAVCDGVHLGRVRSVDGAPEARDTGNSWIVLWKAFVQTGLSVLEGCFTGLSCKWKAVRVRRGWARS